MRQALDAPDDVGLHQIGRFLHPELTKSATSEEVHEIGNHDFEQHICSNRTCELGMNLATGKDYRSVIFLLEELTRPATESAGVA